MVLPLIVGQQLVFLVMLIIKILLGVKQDELDIEDLDQLFVVWL